MSLTPISGGRILKTLSCVIECGTYYLILYINEFPYHTLLHTVKDDLLLFPIVWLVNE